MVCQNCLILRFGSLIAYKPYCLLSINSGVVVYDGSLLPNAYKSGIMSYSVLVVSPPLNIHSRRLPEPHLGSSAEQRQKSWQNDAEGKLAEQVASNQEALC